MNGFNWPQEAVELLTLRMKEGVVHSAIAAELGLTRNAVLGKAKRLGLLGGRGGGRTRQEAGRENGFKNGLSMDAAKKRMAALKKPAPIVREPAHAKPPLMCSLVDIPAKGCHWPLGDPLHPGFGFCGNNRAGRSYCKAHEAIAYQPPRRAA